MVEFGRHMVGGGEQLVTRRAQPLFKHALGERVLNFRSMLMSSFLYNFVVCSSGLCEPYMCDAICFIDLLQILVSFILVFLCHKFFIKLMNSMSKQTEISAVVLI